KTLPPPNADRTIAPEGSFNLCQLFLSPQDFDPSHIIYRNRGSVKSNGALTETVGNAFLSLNKFPVHLLPGSNQLIEPNTRLLSAGAGHRQGFILNGLKNPVGNPPIGFFGDSFRPFDS